MDLEGVSEACANGSALPVTVLNLASSVEAFDTRLCALEDTSGLEVGGGADLSRNSRINKNKRNGANGGISGGMIVNIP